MSRHDRDLALDVRDLCVRTFLAAYEDAGIRGLCGEGRVEVALDAVRALGERELLAAEDGEHAPSTDPRLSRPD